LTLWKLWIVTHINSPCGSKVSVSVATVRGESYIDEEGPAKYNVNLSGGMLAGNPIMTSGLYRMAEAVLQLKGDAGERQAADVNRAIAQSTTGGAGQFHTVVVLEK